MADKLDNSAPFNDDQGTRRAQKPTGAGAEAAEGIHGEPRNRDQKRDPSDNTSLTDRTDETNDARKGSEPFKSNSHEHLSGYGGKGGVPKTPNDDETGRR
ncbi:MAG TPA: hypothetical protein VEB19_01220 [Gemmatimonadaceae bacterium]|nr:hypothetical protein [Gemmatimonadaceae bacterium]